MKVELQRLEPWSAVRVGFFIGIFAGLFFAFYLSAALKQVDPAALGISSTELSTVSGMSTVMLVIIMSLVGSLVYSMAFGLFAIIYNAIAKLFGGLEFHTATFSTPDEKDNRVTQTSDESD